MERYNEYKDSGVEWIGKIPSHWEVLPIKRIAETFPGATPTTSNVNNWDGNIPWITPADFKTDTKYVKDGSRSITEQGLKSCSTRMVPTNSVIFSKRAPVGQLSITTQPLSTNQGCISCVSRPIIKPTFLFYLLSVYKDTFEAFSGGTTFKEISLQTFNDFNVSLPPLLEQEAIANYLDAATSKIDAAIAQQQKMIDLLNERKQIIINNAVTKGLVPNVPMKDSGVKWLGEIPSHWEVLALKHILKLKKEIVGKRSSQYDLLSLTLKGVVKRDIENPEGKFPASFDTYQVVQPNDFVFCNFDNEETPRAVGLSPYKGMITGAYDVLSRKNANLSDKYLIYYLLYIDDAKRFKPLYKGLRKTVPFNSFMSYKIPIPSLREQEAIANYLDSVTSKLDAAIAQQQKMISLLQERKQILINDVVTGKFKVL